jgi:hypothetical protein
VKQKYFKIALSILGVIYCFYYLSTLGSWHFIDNVDLVIHEGGHVIFLIFGKFLYILGGSLTQIILPAIFAGYFYVHKQKYSASLVLYWVAINFFSVAHYAADAMKMQLPLLGGDTSGHDWHNLLSMVHLLPATNVIAGLIYLCGILTIFFSLYLSYIDFGNYNYDSNKKSL